MKKELKDILDKDFVRYGRKRKMIDVFRPRELNWLVAMRATAFYGRKSLVGLYWFFRYCSMEKKTMIQIPSATKIGKGFYIGHCGRIIVNKEAVIGDNVNIGTGVVIGNANRGEKKGAPTIGNEVWIGTNAAIVGKITIGDDVLIAPNAYVNFDVPSHSIVVGNPGVIHPTERACEWYVNNMV